MTDERRGMPIKRRADGGEFDLSTWNLSVQDSEEFRGFIGKAVTEVIELAAGDKVFADFAVGRNFDHVPKDVTIIHVQLPFGAEEFEGPEWTFTLTELVEWDIHMNLDADGFLDPHTVPGMTALRDALHALADRIDSVLPKTGNAGRRRRGQP